MKRNILRIMTFCTLAVLALASCKKDNGNDGNVPEKGFRATVEANQGNGGRTHLVGTEVQWNAGDQIVVRNGNGTSATFSLSAGENTMNGTFLNSQSGDDFFQPTYTAIYPAAEGNSITGEGTATFTLPATQSYVANSFANGAMPMMAVSGEQTLEFKNALGGICFPMVGDNLTVTRLVLTSNSVTDHLSGVFSADYNNGQPTLSYTSGGSNSITLDCGAGVALDATTATDFIIMVPAGSLANGFKLEAYNGESKVFEKSNNNNLGADFIPRSVIRKVNQNLEIVVTSLAVTTISPTFITTNSALGLGAVDNTPVTCGILYALASDLATPADDLVIGGTNVTNLSGTTGTRFDASLTGLAADQIYYVRAYATNEVGTVSYGDPVPFATRYDYYSAANKGKSRSVFTVRANNTRVRFSMGNLQYIGSAGSGSAFDNNAGAYWKFADYQFDYFGDNGQGSTKIKQDRDLFGWGTSGINDYTPRATRWQPWSTSTEHTQYNPYGDAHTNLNSNGGKADWGYNAISNGGNTVNGGWRTLQGGTYGGNTAEWNYLLNTRTCGYHRYAQVQLTLKGTSGMSYTTVNQVPACGTTVNGMIVFPDRFTWPATVNALTTLDAPSSSWGVNKLTEAQWSLLEQKGAIFLPAAGFRSGTLVNNAGTNGDYWSSTYYYDGYYAYGQNFWSGYVGPQNLNYTYRDNGFSVRLVYPAN